MSTLRHQVIPSPVGPLLLVADEQDRLVRVHIDGDPAGSVPARGGVLDTAAQQLGEYFAAERRVFDLPTHATGTALQERVWAALTRIPYGTTTTYGAMAADLGLSPRAARAVGAANGRNPLAIVVPCHRVIGAGGRLTGYAGGLDAKRVLLEHETTR